MRVFLGVLLLTLALSVQARIEIHQFDDPEKEALYNELIRELRCLVCQNQNLADSNAELAQDLRQQTYKMVEAGKSKQDVVDYMVERYGDFVLYKPPFKGITALLWVGPFVILFFGLITVIFLIRGRQQVDPNTGPSEQDLERARKLLEDDQ
jgi:cytochrome c-type biogenesis protein CcmH